MTFDIKQAINSELKYWEADGRRFAADSLIRIAELLSDTGIDVDLPALYARRDCRVLDR
jgi:hypothetical protein